MQFRVIVTAGCLALASLTSSRAAEDDVTANMRSLGAKFLVTGFHAGWAGDSEQIVFSNYPSEAGLQIVDVRTRKARELLDVGKDPSWSPAKEGPIAYVRGDVENEQIWLVTATGKEDRRLASGGNPRWNPDGTILYFHSRTTAQIMSLDTARGGEPALFCEMSRSWYPAISPDRKRVAFVEQGRFVIDEAANAKTTHTWKLPSARGGLVDWSPDGKLVAFGGYGGDDGVGLWIMNLETKKAAQVDPGPFTQPMFSPDGQKIAVDLRADAKRREVWVLDRNNLDDLKFTDAEE